MDRVNTTFLKDTSMNSILETLADALTSGAVRVIDLTQPLSPSTPVIELPEPFKPSPGFSMDTLSRFDDGGPAWYWNAISMGEHTGTHFDAPAHWITGKNLPNNSCDTIEPGRFVGAACVIDVTAQCADNPDFLLEPEHIRKWEQTHGKIPPHSWVLLRTDWSLRTSPESFVNADAQGPHTPGPSAKAASFLANERDILGFGVETIGTDAGQAGAFDPPFPNHTIMHGSGKFGLASLCNLSQLPPTGSIVIAAPLKIVDGSGSPLRVLALVPGDSQ
jgi:kynurenine formamidase